MPLHENWKCFHDILSLRVVVMYLSIKSCKRSLLENTKCFPMNTWTYFPNCIEINIDTLVSRMIQIIPWGIRYLSTSHFVTNVLFTQSFSGHTFVYILKNLSNQGFQRKEILSISYIAYSNLKTLWCIFFI